MGRPLITGSAFSAEVEPFRILTVCEGNICRSPLTAQLLSVGLYEARLTSFVTVESAGLRAMVGEPMDALPAQISVLNGGDPSAHRAQQITPQLIGVSHLILTMTRAQRDQVIALNPRGLQRTFSVGEMTQLMASLITTTVTQTDAYLPDAAERLRLKTSAMSRIRSKARVLPSDDIADPYRTSAEVHEAVGEQIAIACRHLMAGFVGWSTAEPEVVQGW